MGAKKGGGGAGIAALVVAVLAFTGNLGAAVDAVGSVFDQMPQTTGSDRTGTPRGAKVSEESEKAVTQPGSVTMPDPRAAQAVLDSLTVAPRVRGSDPTYDRDQWGPAWADVDGNGCKQRQDVLYQWLDQDQTSTVRPRSECRHEVYAGTWHDPYTGRTITLSDAKDPAQARLVQIDHLVPLSEAHKSGAAWWSAEQKAKFAGDLVNLTPVYGPSNTTKSDSDPAGWRPRAQYQCDYARRYISVKGKWSLSVDPSEKDALGDMLNTCR